MLEWHEWEWTDTHMIYSVKGYLSKTWGDGVSEKDGLDIAQTHNSHSQRDRVVCLSPDRREKRKEMKFKQLTPPFIVYT